MSDLVFYSIIMFWSGVFLTKAVFYFDMKRKKRRFYLLMSAAILQVLDSIYTCHMAVTEYASTELKNIDSIEENDIQEYLRKEGDKISIFMDLYTLLFIKATPESGREYINYRTWKEAHALILKMREAINHEKNKG
tara:strand:- start:1855 stop:2262 length:408 start_codon:yes stop_codon:yes gene_type:complete